MGNNFHLPCEVETRKVVWLVGLVLASVLIIQYFELPHRDSMQSLLSSGKAYFPIPGANGGSPVDTDIKGKPSPLEENLVPKNTSPTTLAPEKDLAENFDVAISPSISFVGNTTVLNSGKNPLISASPTSLDLSLAPMSSPSPSMSPGNMDAGHGAPVVASSPPPFANVNGSSWNNKTGTLKSDRAPAPQVASSLMTSSPPEEKPTIPPPSVVTTSEMNDMWLHSQVSVFAKRPLWPSPADQELVDARIQIEHAPIVRDHPSLYAPLYRNLSKFLRSYEIMEQKLKVYIYKDGKRPVFHHPNLQGIYSSEGWFMKLLKESDRFLTSNPGEAHLFYLPFSSKRLEESIYVPDSHTFREIHQYLKSYTNTIKTRYPFWNRTDGVDHFLVACHDWAPYETKQYMANCMRALCNADLKEGFQFGKDISLPETYVHTPQNPMRKTGGSPPSQRKTLAFFAGQMHGYVRPILLKHWENKDSDMKIYGAMPKGLSYDHHMKTSKYCICPRGYEVNSPRVVEAIVNGCVPVIISDNFVPPFFDILRWERFAVFVLEKDIPNLKKILMSISDRRYLVMYHRVTQLRQHFIWHKTPVKYDIFHMILHSIWHNRVSRLSP